VKEDVMSLTSVDRAVAVLNGLAAEVERRAHDRVSITQEETRSMPVFTEIERIAKQISAERSITEAQAVTAVMQERRDLAERYRVEKRQGISQWTPPATVTKVEGQKVPALIELERVARDLQRAAAATGQELTDAQAISLAAEKRPDLHAAYREQRRHAR
jgi:hypothetical protein